MRRLHMLREITVMYFHAKNAHVKRDHCYVFPCEECTCEERSLLCISMRRLHMLREITVMYFHAKFLTHFKFDT